MAKYSNTVEYNIKTTLDSTGIAKLQAELSQLKNYINQQGAKGLIPQSSITRTLDDIKTIQNALNTAFNPKLGMMNSSALFSNLKKEGMSVARIYQSFSAAGAEGQKAFTSLYGQITKLDTGLRSVSKTTDKIMNTVGNTMRWGLIASGFSQIMNAAHQAVEYTKELDTSLTNIMMVSGQSRDNMNEFAKQANQAAQALGATTTQMTEAAKVFVQQGMNTQQSLQMGEYAVHLANISEQDSATTSDELTAMKNAFKLNIDDMGNAISKWAAIANNTAVDMEELSVASQKAASVAQTTGVTMEQFAGHIAAIESTTREAPENIGNGLKTLYSRFADVKLGKELEDGVDLGQFASALKKVGVEVLDEAGKMKDVGVILEDTMKVWGQLDKTQQNALATTVAGRFQLGRFEALMNSQDIYRTATGVAQAETGTATYDMMQETYMESLEGKTKTLQAKIEEIFNNLFTTDNFGVLIDGMSGLVDVLNDLIEATGGGQTALLGIVTLMGKLANESLSRGIGNFVTNRQSQKLGQQNLEAQRAFAREQLEGQGLNTSDERMNAFVNDKARINQFAPNMNDEQIRQANELTEQRIAIENQLTDALKARNDAEIVLRAAMADNAEASQMTREQLSALAQEVMQMTDAEILAEDRFKLLRGTVTNLATDFNKYFSAIKQGTANEIVMQEGAQRLAQKLEAFSKSGVLTEQQMNKLAATLKRLKAIADGDAQSLQRLAEKDQQFIASLSEMASALTLTDEKLVQVVRNLGVAETNVASLTAAVETARGHMEAFAYGLNLQNLTNQFLNIGNAAMTGIFAIQSLRSAIEVLNDNSISPGEKFEKLALDLSMVAVMGIPAIQQTVSAIKGIKSAIQEWVVAQDAMRAATSMAAAEELLLAEATGIGTAATIEQRIATIAGGDAAKFMAAQELVLTAATEALTPAKIAEIAATAGVTEETAIQIAAKLGLITVNEGLLASILPLIAAAAPFIAVAAGIGLVIAGIVLAVQQADEQFHKFDKAVEEAGNKVKAAGEQFSEINQKMSDIDSALKSLDENPFEGLTRGTNEWNEALQNANASVLELIDKYPELAQHVTHGENGQLTFNKQGLESYRDIVVQQQGAAAAMVIAAKQEESAAKEQQSSVNLLRSKDFSSLSRLYERGTSGPAYVSDRLLGTVKTDEEGGAEAIKSAALYLAQNQEKTKLGTEELASILQKEIGVSEKVAAELAKQPDSLLSLGRELQSNTTALQATTQAYASQINSQSKKYLEADAAVQSMVDAKTAEQLANAAQSQTYQDAIRNFDQNTDWKTGAAQQQYADSRWGKGNAVWDSTSQSFRSSTDHDQVLMEDNGHMYDTIRNAYAINEMMGEIASGVDGLTASLQGSYNRIKTAIGEKGASIFAGNGEINGSALQSLGADLGNIDFSNLQLSDLRAMGFEGYDDFKAAFEEASQNNPVTPKIDTESKYDFDNDEEINSYLEDNTNIDRSTLDTATQLRVDEHKSEGQISNIQDAQIVETTERLSEAREKYGEKSEEALRVEEELKEVQESSNKATSVYEKALQRAAAAAARQSKALEDMNDHFEDNVKILEEGNTSSTEYAEALTETKEDLAGLLDVDMDSLSNSFVSNAETLDLMRESAEGNEEAFSRLRELASEDIIQNLQINTTDAYGKEVNADEVRNTLTSMIDDLNSQNLGIDVAADIDTADWYARVNELLASGALTADQLRQVLSSAGYEGEIRTEKGSGLVPKTTYTITPGELTNVGTDENPVMFPSNFTMTPETTMEEMEVDIPVLEGATQKGGIVNNAGGGHTGGSGGGGGGCFIAGTPITLQGYYKKIEDIKEGDVVLSYNLKTKQNEYSVVVQTMIHDVYERIYTLYIENEELKVTGIHRFLVIQENEQKWIAASDLAVNDLVLFADGSLHKIKKIKSKLTSTRVYNFEVSGNHNYYVGYNKILAHNKGGGGGGGSAKDDHKEVDRKTKAELPEMDIYEKINEKLKEIEHKLDRVGKARERAWGSNARKNIEKEIGLLERENALTQEHINQSERKLNALRTGRDSKTAGVYFDPYKPDNLADVGLKTNSNGMITNYKQVFDKELAIYKQYNEEADKFYRAHGGQFDENGNVTTKASMNEEESKQYDELAEKAEKQKERVEAVNTITKNYNETLESIREDTDKIQENYYKIEDLIIEIWKNSRDAAKQFSKMQDQSVEMRKNFANMWGEDSTANLGFAFESFENLVHSSSQIDDYIKDAKQHLKDADDDAKGYWKTQISNLQKAKREGTSVLDLNKKNMEDIMHAVEQFEKTGRSDLFGTNEEEMMKAWQECWEDAVDLSEELADRIETIREEIQNVMDDMYETMDFVNGQFDSVQDQYEYLKDMSSLIYGDEAYAQQRDLALAQAKANEDKLAVLEKEYETNHKIVQQEYDANKQYADQSDAYKAALEQEESISKEILSVRKQITQQYKDAKEASNELAIQNWLDNFSGQINGVTVPLDQMQNQWERIKENADLYLDDLNRAAELTKLENRYVKMLNDATDPNIQRQITEQMEKQLGTLRAKKKLGEDTLAISEYDVKYANAQLDILQKTIALQEAQAAKNSMKLRRDSQGNYNYVYTADQSQVKDKENELLDSQMDAYNMSVEEATAAQDRYMNKVQQMADQLRQVANDDSLTKEQIAAITADIIAQGYEFLNAQSEQLTEAQKNAVNSFIEAAQELSAENSGVVQDISKELEEGTTKNADKMTAVMFSAVENWVGPNGLAKFRDEADETVDHLKENVEEFEWAMSEANTKIKDPLGNIQTQFDETNNSLTKLVDTTKEFYDYIENKSNVVRNAAADLATYQQGFTDVHNEMSAYYSTVTGSVAKGLSRSLAAQSKDTPDAQKIQEVMRMKSGQFKKGDRLTIKAGTEVFYGRGGGQSDSAGNRSYIIPKDFDIRVGNPKSEYEDENGKYTGELAKYEVSFWPVEKGWQVHSTDEDGRPSPERRQHEHWHLNADALAAAMLKSGGYTGEWSGDTDNIPSDWENGRLAVLHEKELVLNASDTANILKVVQTVRQLVSTGKDFNFASLGTSAIGASQNNIEKTIEQRVDVNASFPNATDGYEIKQAIMDIANNAYQYAYSTNNTSSLASIAAYQGLLSQR